MQTNEANRIEMIDALRGFAIFAILLVHSLDHFLYGYPKEIVYSSNWLKVLDDNISNILFYLFSGKAYVIFALLFGFTFYVQNKNQQMKGNDFGYRFLWRLTLLILFATVNALFFPAGDVLLMFAIVGSILFVVRHWSNKSILLLSIVFLLQPLEWYHFIMHLIDKSFQVPNNGYKIWLMNSEIIRNMSSGDICDIVLCNITTGQKASFLWAISSGRLEQTAGLFLLGFYLGRKQYFVINQERFFFWKRFLVLSVLFYVLFYLLYFLIKKEDSFIQQTVGVAFDMWQKVSFSFVLLSLFILLYQNKRVQKNVTFLRPYGRMSLTNYIFQSVIGAIVYFPICLNLVQYSGATMCIILGVLVFIMQVFFSKWWLQNNKQGPLETLWYRLTWLKF